MQASTSKSPARYTRLRVAASTGLAGLLAFGLAGCKSKNAQDAANAGDPAEANMAQPYTGGDAGNSGQTEAPAQVMGQSSAYQPQSNTETFQTQAPAPIIRHRAATSDAGNSTQYYPVPQSGGSQASYGSPQASYPGQGSYSDQQDYSQSGYDQGYNDGEYAGAEAIAEADQPPPPLPVYDQPPAPEDDYEWTPGYWNYASAGYYWVPGAWVAPPYYGALWTPPYWSYDRGHYSCHRGYWGPHVGYYGGVNYGFGYVGVGYFGGYWQGRDFYYNRAVTNVNVTNIHNVYNRTVVVNNVTYGPRTTNYISYNGGRGGLQAQPRPQEMAAMREAHFAPVAAQQQNRLAAASNRAQFFSANQGRPAEVFAGRPIGNVRAINAAPAAQPFNHPAPNALAVNPGVRNPNQPGTLNPPGAPRPSAINQPGGLRPGIAVPPAANQRPGPVNQPGLDNGRMQAPRPGTPVQPAVRNDRAIEGNRTAITQPSGNNARPGFNNRPNAEAEPNRAGQFPRPANQPAPARESNARRPSPPTAAPSTERPAPEAQRTPTPPPARPNIQQRPQVQQTPEMEQRPQPEQRPQTEQRPQVQQRPQLEQHPLMEPRPTQARPEAARPEQARPAPAPSRAPAPAASPRASGAPHGR